MKTLSECRASFGPAVDVLRQARAHHRLHHAYILAGSAADELAAALSQTLLCKAPEGALNADACGRCAACRKLAGGNHADVTLVQPNDKQVIGVDAVRQLTARLSLRSQQGGIKIAQIHAAHTLLAGAQNALLKCLEEPAGDTLFLLMTQRTKALLPTLRSRCQLLLLRPTSPSDDWQELTLPADLQALMRDALQNQLAAAQQWEQQGAAQVWQTLAPLVTTQPSAAAVFAAAASLGADKHHAEMALALLEVALRNALVQNTRPQHAAAAAKAVIHARASQRFNPNRAMVLEGVLMAWAGL